MMHVSPFKDYLDSLDAMMLPYGPGVEIAGQCDAVELEYAAIRKSVGLFDSPHRGLLKLTGKDRLDFLHRMVTNDCNGLKPGQTRRAFLLNSKGRIMADLRVVHFDHETLVESDIHCSKAVAEELHKLLFSEDVVIEDLSEALHGVSLHGPAVGDVLKWWLDGASGSIHYEYEEYGVPGAYLWGEGKQLLRFAEKAESLLDVFRLRFVGWHAVNIARVESGRAMFNVDFGPTNLPHEAGPDAMNEAVSFTKGCYRGQEIVARMQNLGHPARRLVGFRVEGSDALPLSGVEVRADDSPEARVVGAVTSSTLSPMLGSTPVGFAMVKWGHHEDGTKLFVPAEGKTVAAQVCPMRFYPPQN